MLCLLEALNVKMFLYSFYLEIFTRHIFPLSQIIFKLNKSKISKKKYLTEKFFHEKVDGFQGKSTYAKISNENPCFLLQIRILRQKK